LSPDAHRTNRLRGGYDTITPVDLTRLSKSYDREGYRRIIAAHLIEITGESFGTDSAAWRKWSESR
jgi:hypothetical protein